MQLVFLDMAGHTLFTRDDAERAEWTQEEGSLDLELPYLDDKRISIGQRVFFKDPSTGSHQLFEVKQAKTIEPEHYQNVLGEHICISELTDDHIDEIKNTGDVSAQYILSTVLTGTLWNVGNVYTNPTSTASISRGSVWQAILTIKQNWNVYIEPRVSLAADGTITRYLDIIPPDGLWNGIRLSVDKNMLDPSVIYDDSEVVTALFGYGGTIVSKKKEDKDKKVDFSEVVWELTPTHPAKPYGQRYIEDTYATEHYGRNGRARFGFYQNTDIKDANLLLQKTWEALEAASKPAISIEGTVTDLHRLGYADQPICLHDIALVEVLPAGFKQQLQIIRVTTDLIDPSATTLTIGAYIPNIVYVNKETTTKQSGGGGNKNKGTQTERQEFETAIEANSDRIALRAWQNDLDDLTKTVKLQEAAITVEHNRITAEVTDRRNADAVLNSTITQTATQIRAEVSNVASGLRSTITQTASQIRAEVSNSVSGLYSSITQTASQIRSMVYDVDNGLRASITQTASQIRTEVSASMSGLASSITETASQIRTEVSNSVSGLQSSITETASQIRTEVSNSVSGLQSSITQNSDKISLVVTDDGQGGNKVDAASIVAGINNQTGSYVTIQANKINLSGYVTTSMLESAFTSAQQIATEQMTISQYFTCLGYNVSWQSKTIKNIQLSTERAFLYGSTSAASGTVTGKIIISSSESTLYYLGR